MTHHPRTILSGPAESALVKDLLERLMYVIRGGEGLDITPARQKKAQAIASAFVKRLESKTFPALTLWELIRFYFVARSAGVKPPAVVKGLMGRMGNGITPLAAPPFVPPEAVDQHPDPELVTANYEFKTNPFKLGAHSMRRRRAFAGNWNPLAPVGTVMGRPIMDIGTAAFKTNPYKFGGMGNMGYTRLDAFKLGYTPIDPFKMGSTPIDPFKMGSLPMDPFKMGSLPMDPFKMGATYPDPFKMGQWAFAQGVRRAQMGAAAATVTAAKKGNRKAKAAIAKVKKAADKGHPGAKQAMKDMRTVDAAQKRRAVAVRLPAPSAPTAPPPRYQQQSGGFAHGLNILTMRR